MDRRTILNQFSFYQEASPAHQSVIEKLGQYITVPSETFLYHEGDRCEQCALIGTGSIRVFKADTNGHEVTLYHVQDGQTCMVNMLSIFLERPAAASAIVEVPTEAVVIPATAFRHWVDSDRDMRKFVFESMAMRLIDVMVLAEELAFRKLDQRLAHLLLDHYPTNVQSFPVVSMTHDELARELGTAREVISRLLKEFEQLGAIAISRGQIKLLDRNALIRLIK